MRHNSTFGHTLIEVVVTLSLGTSLTGLAVGLVHQAMTIKSISNDRADHDRDAERLVWQFREDVVRAESADSLNPENIEFRSKAPREINYAADNNRVTRIETVDNDLVRRETYELAETFVARFAVNEKMNEATIVIVCMANLDGERIDRKVNVHIGRWSRYQHRTEKVEP
ncbi:hypothetical protein CA13_71770 [Planctomycetes bacterium CA13]|uniref:Uncharacterized protein n=1 Tax=Novipirellula herctigrandis TaxID=2527986 RepID=A0A5C5YPL0_9BACT|nr:hypothetical protein CA13_71770 [Planctomycetes bacterium CA13]